MDKIFNCNDYVKVKLTKEGLKILKSQYNEILRGMTSEARKSMGAFKPPKVDEDGYSEFQLWQVMHYFGKYLYNGSTIHPIGSCIKISEKYLYDSIEDVKY